MYFNKYKQEPKIKITNKHYITNYTSKTKSKSQIKEPKNKKNNNNQINNTDLIFNLSLNNSNRYKSYSIDDNIKIEETKELKKLIGTQSPIQKKENLTPSRNNKYNNKKNDKLLFTLKTLDLENLLNEFYLNYITFNDIFLLSREDLIEMKIPIGPRNRILYFAEEYKKKAVNYDLNELIFFFQNHKEFIINDNHFNFGFNKNNILNNDNNMIEEPPIPMSKPFQILFNNINNNENNIDNNNNNFVNNNFNNNFRNDILNSPKSNSTKKFIKEKKNNKDIPIPIKVKNIELNNINTNFQSKGSYRQKSSSLVNKEFKLNDIENYNEEENDIDLIYQSLSNSNKKRINARNYNTTSTKNDTNNKYINKSYGYSKQSTMNRSNSYSIQSNNSVNNNINKCKPTSQVLKNFENIFSEVENFQNQYERMKEKSEERNNKINSLLNKRCNSNEIEKIKKQLMNTNYNNNNIKKRNNHNIINNNNSNNSNNMIFINEKDLINESERNLNEELSKIYKKKEEF